MKPASLLSIVVALVAGVFLFSSGAHAQASPSATISLFTVPPGDLSLQALQMVFGNDVISEASTFSTSSSGSPETVLGSIMGSFNTGLLTVVVMVAWWSLIVGVVQGAQHGKLLSGSQGISAFWGPIRIVTSIGALVPLGGSGYSLCQIAVLAMTIQGIGLANSIWSAAVSFLSSGPAPQITSVSTTAPINSSDLAQLARQLLIDQTCIHAYSTFATAAGSSASLAWDSPSPGIFRAGQPSNGIPDGTCGSYQVTQPNPATISTVSSNLGFSEAAAENVRNTILAAQSAGLQAMMAKLQPAAQTLSQGSTGPGDPNYTAPPASTISDAVAAYQNAAASQINGSLPQLTQTVTGKSPTTSGWMAAGAYYYQIGNFQFALENALAAVPSAAGPQLMQSGATEIETDVAKSVHNADEFAAANGAPGIVNAAKDKADSWAQWAWSNLKGAGHYIANISSPDTFSTGFWTAWSGATVPVQNALLALANSSLSFNGGTDPVQALISVGHAIIGLALVAGGIAAWIGAYTAIPLIFMLLFAGLAMAVGTVAAPMVLWISVSISWLVSTVMAVCVAPIWLVANANPRGDEWMSEKAKHGAKFAVGLMVKPSLMIMGLLAAMIVLRIGAWIIGQLFAPTAAAALGSSSGITGVVSAVGMLFIAAGLVTWLVFHSMVLIHVLPEHALSFIGHFANIGDAGSHEKVAAIVAGFHSQTERAAPQLLHTTATAAQAASDRLLGGPQSPGGIAPAKQLSDGQLLPQGVRQPNTPSKRG